MGQPPASSSRDPRENSEWLSRALSAARLGTWEWDIPSGAVTWSREVLGIFGVSEFGGNLQSWNQLVHPADRDFVKVVIERALQDHTSTEFRIEHRALRPSGSVVWVEGCGEIQRA